MSTYELWNCRLRVMGKSKELISTRLFLLLTVEWIKMKWMIWLYTCRYSLSLVICLSLHAIHSHNNIQKNDYPHFYVHPSIHPFHIDTSKLIFIGIIITFLFLEICWAAAMIYERGGIYKFLCLQCCLALSALGRCPHLCHSITKQRGKLSGPDYIFN